MWWVLLIDQNVPTWVTNEMNRMERKGVRDFLEECETSNPWEFERSILEDAKTHIDKLWEDLPHPAGRVDFRHPVNAKQIKKGKDKKRKRKRK